MRPTLFKFVVPMIIVATAAPSFAQSQDDAGINALYTRMSDAVTRVDATAAQTIYNSESIYLGTGSPPIIGRDSIISAFDSSWKAAAASGGKADLKFRILQRIWHSKDSATDVGFSKFSLAPSEPGKPVRAFYSKFSTLVQRQPDGNWIFRVDIDNQQSTKTGAAEFDALQPVNELKFDR